jgi:phosphohistidine phosphatase
MRTLLLLRHSKAVPSDKAVRDEDRLLIARGRGDALRMGAYMARHALIPDHAIVSPAKRTRETWQAAATAFGTPPPARYDSRLYDAAPQAIMEVIKETGGAAPKLLLVGHNPSLQKLAMLLIAAGDLDARERLSEALPTSGLVTIDFVFDNWMQLRPQAGRLSHFVTPSSLSSMAD